MLGFNGDIVAELGLRLRDAEFGPTGFSDVLRPARGPLCCRPAAARAPQLETVIALLQRLLL